MKKEKKFRKPAVMALAGLLSVSILAACGGDEAKSTETTEGTKAAQSADKTEKSESDASGDAAEKSETASAKMETVRVWTNDGNYQTVMDPIVEEFNNGAGLEEGINIEYEIFGSDYHDVLKVALAADQGPEIYKFVGTVKEPFITSGWMVPIDDMPGGEAVIEPFKDILLNGYTTFDGKTYSLPFKVLATKFMYNKDLLAKSGIDTAPETWDDVVEYAKKVTDDNNGEAYGYGVHLKDAASSGKWYFATHFATSVGHMGYDFATGKFAFADFTENIEKILQMKADGSIFPGGEGMDGDAMMAQFAAGKIAMTTGVHWDVSNVDNYWTELETSFELGVCDTPVIDSGNKYKNYAQIGDVLCLGSRALDMPEKSMRVFALFHSDDVQLAIQNNEVDFMARADIQEQAPASFSKAGTAEFGDTSNSYFTLTPPDGGITVEGQPYQNTIINLIAGPANADVASVLEDLDNRYNTALEDAISDGFDMKLYIDEKWDTKSVK